MDKQEKKRDVAVFANMLKELMNDSLDDNLVTLDRDLQHFLYGRVAVLVKHNEGQPIGSVGDLGAIVGGAFATILGEFISSRVQTAEDLQKLVLTAKENLEIFNLLDIEYELLGTDFGREFLVIEK